ncbi:nuclease [Rhynchospora pubera]|uniref:Nuclease n=1 Tax=Rhynchospora pubera TaxID=906938 RepID=A0AAV8FG09_9POAL|nr:nuclease [Rhynchospora pubera]
MDDSTEDENLDETMEDEMMDEIIEDEMIFSDAIDMTVIMLLEEEIASLNTRNPQNTRKFTGFQIVTCILSGNPVRSYTMFRMSSTNFRILCDKISSRLNQKKITAEEQLAIFLDGLGHGISIRKLGEYYQHSSETIHRLFKDVLKAILSLYDEYIKLPDANTGVHPIVGPDSRNYLFKDALGAIDGTHIQAVVKKAKSDRFRNRKGFISQNVLAACSFDMLFQYVAIGWEGSASDMRVLRWAVEEGGFDVPNGRYYLADSGYANTSKFICPFRNHNYHLAQFNRQPISSRYRVPEELYNHRHAQLRNVIERTFGVLKIRFKILDRMPAYKFRKQGLVVMACCIIHNFIKLQNAPDLFLDRSRNVAVPNDSNENLKPIEEISRGNESSASEIIRNNIKNGLWRQRRRTN